MESQADAGTKSTASPKAESCTSFLLKAADRSPVYGRTMEFGFKLQSDAIVIPRQYTLMATGPGAKPGLTWKTATASWASMLSELPSSPMT